jgi:hypothetical protein
MNRKCTLLLSLIFICLFAQAKIWRVNNNASANADFTTATDAHNGAQAGDTLHFESSNISYGNITLTKKLILIGLGHFLSANPGLQSTPVASRLATISLNAGAEGSVICVASENISVNVSNITIFRTQVANLTIGGSNTLVINCYISNTISFTGTTTGAIISNNIIGDRIAMNVNHSATITHNVINAVSNNSGSYNNSDVHSNIFNKPTASGFVNCAIEFNICSNTNLPEGNGNQRSVNMADVFVNNSSLVDNGFLLKPGPGNLAVGTGKNGADCGAFGSVTPFNLGMIPNVPTIYNLTVPAAPSGNSMEIKVSTRVNN